MAGKRKPQPERIMGKYSGAVRNEDGSIQLAPMYVTPLRRILDREHGLNALLEKTNEFVAKEHAKLVEEHREWWGRIQDDHGLSRDDGWRWQFRGDDLLIQTPPPEKDESPTT